MSLGVTALLDDLLKEEAKLDRDMAAMTGRPIPDAAGESQELAGEEEPQLSPEDQRALAELHEEVDGCLAGMDDWREESRLRRLKLEKELEAEFGFSCHVETDARIMGDSLTEGDESPTQTSELCQPDAEDAVDEHDMSRYLGGAGRRQHREERAPLAPLMDAQIPRTHDAWTSGSSAKAEVRDEARRADVDRIEKLRAEVEAMRQQQVALDAYDGMVPDDDLADTMTTMPGMGQTGMNDWCAEVDAVLGGDLDPSFSADLNGIGYLQAREGLNEIDSGLEAASSRVNADILEMEKMLEECNAAIQARKNTIDN